MLMAVNESQPTFELSYGRIANNNFSAFPIEFLDALTHRSKKYILNQCFICFRQFPVDKLPSPAVFETVARICHSEDYELAVKDLENMAQRSLYGSNSSPEPKAKDQCFFLFDFLAYRVPHLAAYSKGNLNSVMNVLGHLTHHMSNNPQNHQIYRIMEQFLLRRWCWSGFHECIANHTSLLGASNKESAITRYILHPKSFYAPVDNAIFPVNPEIFKMTMYNFLRAVKITGQEVAIEGSSFPALIAGYGWPKKSVNLKEPPSWLGSGYDRIERGSFGIEIRQN
uniref:Mediator of RNA polymerase II transcription subunit 23 n=1 Tax=Caenorhabditis japonica TaxID=281687 RepID=A0A8R1E6G4_CAEJA